MELYHHKIPAKSRVCALNARDATISSWTALVGGSDGSITKIVHQSRPTAETTIVSWADILAGEIKGLCLSSSGEKFAACAKLGGLIVGSTDTGAVHCTFRELPDAEGAVKIENSVQFVPMSESKVLAAYSGGQIKLFSLDDEHALLFPNGHRRNPITKAVPITESLCVSGSTDRTARLNDSRVVDGGGVVFKHNDWVYGVSAVNENLIASACRNSLVYVWDPRRTAQPIHEFHEFRLPSVTCDLSLDAKILVAGSLDKSAVIWNISDGSVLRRIQLEDDTISDVHFSHDRQVLLSSGHGGTVGIFDVAMEERQKAQLFTKLTRLPKDIGDFVTAFMW